MITIALFIHHQVFQAAEHKEAFWQVATIPIEYLSQLFF